MTSIRFILVFFSVRLTWGFPGDEMVKNLPANAADARDVGSIHGVGKIPWSRKWQPTPVFLPIKFNGQRSLEGYSLWGHKESDRLNIYTYMWEWA